MAKKTIQTAEQLALINSLTWLSRKQAAIYLGINACTLDKLIASGQIKSSRVGNQVRINRQWLDAYLSSADTRCAQVVANA